MNVSIPLRCGLAAAMLSLLVAGTAQAACEWSDRIEMDKAECLSGGWENRSWPYKDTAWVQSQCPGWGTVVAKVDRKDAPDWTKWLDGKDRVNMSGSQGNVRGIHCCSDLSDLCNKSDLLTPANCIAQANERYVLRSSCERWEASVNLADDTCTVSAWCTSDRQSDRSSVTVHYLEFSIITVCLGQLWTPDKPRVFPLEKIVC